MFGFSHFISRRTTRQGAREASDLCLDLEYQIEAATSERVAQLARGILTMQDGWETTLEREFAFLLQATKVRAAMRRARVGSLSAPHHESHLRFQVSSLFLWECHEYLTGDPAGRERLHLVTGTQTADRVRVLSRIEKVATEHQSAAYVKADPMATHKQLVALTERDGHDLLAVFHSHIMNGMDSTRPSETDIANQQRFAAIGWDAIGGIFSLDGYVRFYSTCRDFDLQVYGNRADVITRARRETIVKLTGPS
jgi:hypothetical protein